MFFDKKWGILIKKESESLIFTSLKIPRNYYNKKGVVEMPETQDEGYILDDSGLKPYSIEDAEDTKEHK